MEYITELPKTINGLKGYTICQYCGKTEQRSDFTIEVGSCNNCKNSTVIIPTREVCPQCKGKGWV